MTSPEAPRPATVALRNLLDLFHLQRDPRSPDGTGVGMVAFLTRGEVTDRLNELATLERIEQSAADSASYDVAGAEVEGTNPYLVVRAAYLERDRTADVLRRALALVDAIVTHVEVTTFVGNVPADMHRERDGLNRAANISAVYVEATITEALSGLRSRLILDRDDAYDGHARPDRAHGIDVAIGRLDEVLASRAGQ